MTGAAKSLTERANLPAAGMWSMPGNHARAFLESLARLGYDTRQLMTVAGLGDSDLDADARVTCEALAAIVSSAQKQRFTKNLALELARVTPLGAYPLLDYLVATSDTVESAVHHLSRYLRLIGNPIVLIAQQESAKCVRVQMTCDATPFNVEYNAALMILHFRRETAGSFEVTCVSFQHTTDDDEQFGWLLGCDVKSASNWNGLTLPLDVWHLPLRRRDPVLRQVLETHADGIPAALPARTGVALEVQRALASRPIAGEIRIDALARQLAMSGRTLQRRLADEGVSFQQLVDEARREAAARHLADPGLAVGEVAYLVGYSEPAAFHRAFKRWYGTAPEAFRRRAQRG